MGLRRPSVVHLSVVHTLLTSFPQKPLGQSKSNFAWSLHAIGERTFVQTVQVTWPRWPPCPYIFFSGTKRPMTLKVGMQHRVLEYYQVCSNDDPELSLTYFTTRSDLVPYAFLGLSAPDLRLYTFIKSWKGSQSLHYNKCMKISS